MGVQGVPLPFTDDELIDALERSNGRVKIAADYLKIAFQRFYIILKEKPHIQEALDKIRCRVDENALDDAETCLQKAINNHKDMNSALKASFFFLNNKGHKRGYSAKNNPNNQETGVNDLLRGIARVAKNPDDVSGTQESK